MEKLIYILLIIGLGIVFMISPIVAGILIFLMIFNGYQSSGGNY